MQPIRPAFAAEPDRPAWASAGWHGSPLAADVDATMDVDDDAGRAADQRARSTRAAQPDSPDRDPATVCLPIRKRKADDDPPAAETRERLSKRMALLNLEKPGQKLYVPVEDAVVTAKKAAPPRRSPPVSPRPASVVPRADDSAMRLDDTAHKVYIYDLDDELSSSSDDDGPSSASSSKPGKLVFLPDIERHLRANRLLPQHPAVPRPVPPSDDGKVAGMELVLYRDPVSHTLPPHFDPARWAIMEARNSFRERQASRASLLAAAEPAASVPDEEINDDAMELDPS